MTDARLLTPGQQFHLPIKAGATDLPVQILTLNRMEVATVGHGPTGPQVFLDTAEGSSPIRLPLGAEVTVVPPRPILHSSYIPSEGWVCSVEGEVAALDLNEGPVFPQRYF